MCACMPYAKSKVKIKFKCLFESFSCILLLSLSTSLSLSLSLFPTYALDLSAFKEIHLRFHFLEWAYIGIKKTDLISLYADVNEMMLHNEKRNILMHCIDAAALCVSVCVI